MGRFPSKSPAATTNISQQRKTKHSTPSPRGHTKAKIRRTLLCRHKHSRAKRCVTRAKLTRLHAAHLSQVSLVLGRVLHLLARHAGRPRKPHPSNTSGATGALRRRWALARRHHLLGHLFRRFLPVGARARRDAVVQPLKSTSTIGVIKTTRSTSVLVVLLQRESCAAFITRGGRFQFRRIIAKVLAGTRGCVDTR